MRLCGGFSAPFHLPHISRLPLGFFLCSSFVQPLYLYAFCLHSNCVPKNTHKNIVGVDVWASEVYRLPFSKIQHPPGGYRKDRDYSRLFPLSVAAPRLCIVRYFRFSSFNRPQIPLDYSSVESASWAFFSLPIRYRQRGHCLQGHLLTSALLPQQQSKHFNRIALPLVIRSSILSPSNDKAFYFLQNGVWFLFHR